MNNNEYLIMMEMKRQFGGYLTYKYVKLSKN